METEQRKYTRFFTGLLIGGFWGGLIGILFAPRSGKELRSDIKETGDKAFKGTKELLRKASHQFTDARERAKHIVPCVREREETTPRYNAESAEESVGEA